MSIRLSNSSWEPRGLRSICEAIMLDAMYEMPSQEKDELIITTEYASHRLAKIDLKILGIMIKEGYEIKGPHTRRATPW